MTATIPRRLSVVEMQAALDAAWRGEFSFPGRDKVPGAWGKAPESGARGVAVIGERLDRTGTRARGRRPVDLPAGHLTGRVVLVLAAHSGAGASTVAVALSDAAAGAGVGTRLIDCADPARSGIAAVTDVELGEDSAGWRRGRRGVVQIDRLAGTPLNLPDVPAPPPGDADARSVTVVDAGWPAWDVLTCDRWVTDLLDTAVLVVVCRATVTGVRQTEHLLTALPDLAPVVAALGPARWPGVVTASCGPQLRAALVDDRVVPLPLDRRIAVTGLTSAPLPPALLAAGQAVARLALPEHPAAHARTRRGGRSASRLRRGDQS